MKNEISSTVQSYLENRFSLQWEIFQFFDDLQSAEVEYADVRHDIEIQLDVRGIDIENNIIRFSTAICSLDTFIEDFEISRTIYDSVTTERKIEIAAENYFDSMMQGEFSRINVLLKQKGND